MKQIIGFIPKQSTNELHLRVKNLTGNVTEITNDTVTVEFTTLEKIGNKTVEVFLTLKYPLNECEKYFISNEAIKKNGINFHKFCRELEGFEVYYNNNEIPKWQLFWSNIKAEKILMQDGFRLKVRPAHNQFSFN
jgi:hypothetical protein